jgi:small subunit ribosomal protein S16
MLKIRLARGGRKKSPYYRILVTDVTSPRDSNFIEKVGIYNPLLAKDNENRVSIKKDRIEYWLSVGAQPSEKVAKFLIALGVKGAEKYAPKFQPKAKGSNLKKKALEKLKKQKELEEKAKEEAKLKAQEEAEKKAQEEAAKQDTTQENAQPNAESQEVKDQQIDNKETDTKETDAKEANIKSESQDQENKKDLESKDSSES